MQELKKPCLMRCFFLVDVALRVRELSLRTDWLMSQGSLKQLVPLFENAAIFWDFTKVRSVLQKPFIMFCLDLFYWLTFLSTFQTSLQTLELFLFLFFLAFYDISDKFTVFLFLSLHLYSSSKQPLYCLSLLLLLHSLSGLL